MAPIETNLCLFNLCHFLRSKCYKSTKQYIKHILFLFVLKITSCPLSNLIYMVLEVYTFVNSFIFHLWVLLNI